MSSLWPRCLLFPFLFLQSTGDEPGLRRAASLPARSTVGENIRRKEKEKEERKENKALLSRRKKTSGSCRVARHFSRSAAPVQFVLDRARRENNHRRTASSAPLNVSHYRIIKIEDQLATTPLYLWIDFWRRYEKNKRYDDFLPLPLLS